MASTVHQTWGRERNFPAESAAFQCVRWPRPSAGWPPSIESLSAELAAFQCVRWPRPSAGWPPFIESLLLHQIPSASQQGLGFTLDFLVLTTGVIIYPSPLSWKCSLLLVKGSQTSPQMLCPMSESPSGKREGFQDNATRKKGKFVTDLSQGFLPQPSQWCRVRKPRAEAVTQIYQVCISG